ncbi:MAG TPA: 2-succinyl-5-enolpyruvyl-6-hydroxy-3-cyclohexene-1-carboxylic-acid synthase, partial [Candidatus Thermoplasmatota archaeon]|nr:2-succinyl-5-enolpyruvyl-6-hydroxy-3-cyclohexene-1-carboxylic-acid synthase [Candidatus Thermoplasmatota archaeon]
AAANLLPAMIEAWHARAPLVALTADRPHDLRDTGANQAIRQADLFGGHTRWAFDLPPPVVEDRALRHVRAVACRAVAEARGPPAGPVHLNVPLPKPLEPTVVEGDLPPGFAEEHPLAARGRPEGRAFVESLVTPRAPQRDVVDAMLGALGRPRGLIVVGPSDHAELPGAVAALARASGFPVLADPLSGLRFPAAGEPVASYDAFLGAPAAEALAPDVVLRLGAAPTNDALLQWLERTAAPHVIVDEAPWARDPTHRQGLRVAADPARACEALAGGLAGQGETAWRDAWGSVDQAVADALEHSLEEGFFEATALATVLDGLPDAATLMVGSSLPVRDLDRFGRPGAKRLRVLANRGASGIDGVTSTALGASAAGAQPLVLVTGDLSFTHDLSGLMAVKRLGLRAVLVVLHNDGGRIFEQLPAARHGPRFEELFLTPHGLDFEPAAQMFGADFARAEDAKVLREELARALDAPRATVLEVRFDPASARAHRQAAHATAARAAEHALRGLARAG